MRRLIPGALGIGELAPARLRVLEARITVHLPITVAEATLAKRANDRFALSDLTAAAITSAADLVR